MALLDLMLGCKYPENHPDYQPYTPPKPKKKSLWRTMTTWLNQMTMKKNSRM